MGFIRESVLFVLNKDRKDISTILKMIGLDGGKGSGNFGHKGRPGQVGGSGAGGSGSTSQKSEKLPEFMSSRIFKGIAVKARNNPDNSQKFLDSLTQAESEAIIEQYEKSGTKENARQYADRLHRMMAATPKPKHEQKVVDAKSIVDEYHWNNSKVYTNEFGQQIDKQIEDVLEKQGFMGVPRVVSSDEFDKITKEHPEMPILFRSYSAPNEEVLSDYDKQLESGEWYVDCGVGGAQYGQGMYCAGMYIDPPVKWDEDEGAFGSHFPNPYIIGVDGKTYETDSGEDVDDGWMNDGDVYILSKRDGDDVKSCMVEVVDASDEDDDLHLDKLFRDMETDELHDLNWLMDNYPEGQDTQMMKCEERNPEDVYKIDYSGTFEEMRHYREINERKIRSANKPIVPEGKQIAAAKNGNELVRYYFDPKEMKTFKEEQPKPGDLICVGDPDYDDTKALYRVGEDGALISIDGKHKTSMYEFDGKYWQWAKAQGQVEGVMPVSSTRRMTLDPSAKIISYYDLERMGTGGITEKESKEIQEKTFEDLCEKHGIEDADTKAVIKARCQNKSVDKKIFRRWREAQEEKPLEERKAIEKMIYDFDGEFAREFLKRENELENKRQKEVKKFEDFGAYAAALGYDAINAGGHGLSGSYTVVLNRSKLILDEGRVDVSE